MTLTRRTFAALAVPPASPVAGLAPRKSASEGATRVVRLGVLTDMTGIFADLTGNGSVEAARIGGGALRRQRRRPAHRGRLRRPPETRPTSPRRSCASGTTRTGSMRCSISRIRPVPGGGADHARAQQGDGPLGRRHDRPHGPAMLAQHDSLDLGFLRQRQRSGEGRARAGRQAVVLHHRRLRLRDQPRDHHLGARAGTGRHGGGRRPPPARRAGFQLLPPHRPGLGRRRHRAANGGTDLSNAVKQAREFDITTSRYKIVAPQFNLAVAHAAGLANTQGMLAVGSMNWTDNDTTRAFATALAKRNNGIYPDALQAGVYSSVLFYLRAVREVGSARDGRALVGVPEVDPDRRSAPRQGPVAGGWPLHPPGAALPHQDPGRIDRPWDLFETIGTIPGDEAFRPLGQGGCPLVRGMSARRETQYARPARGRRERTAQGRGRRARRGRHRLRPGPATRGRRGGGHLPGEPAGCAGAAAELGLPLVPLAQAVAGADIVLLTVTGESMPAVTAALLPPTSPRGRWWPTAPPPPRSRCARPPSASARASSTSPSWGR